MIRKLQKMGILPVSTDSDPKEVRQWLFWGSLFLVGLWVYYHFGIGTWLADMLYLIIGAK